MHPSRHHIFFPGSGAGPFIWSRPQSMPLAPSLSAASVRGAVALLVVLTGNMPPKVQSMLGMSRRRASAGKRLSRSAWNKHHREEAVCKGRGTLNNRPVQGRVLIGYGQRSCTKGGAWRRRRRRRRRELQWLRLTRQILHCLPPGNCLGHGRDAERRSIDGGHARCR